MTVHSVNLQQVAVSIVGALIASAAAGSTAARLVRFEGVLGRLDERRGLDWGLVARENGYTDQAHLIRDFHQFTGTTPTEFRARTTPPGGDGERQGNFLQDRVVAPS